MAARRRARAQTPPRWPRHLAALGLAVLALLGLEAVARWAPQSTAHWQAQEGQTLLPAHRFLLWVNAPGSREEQGVQVRVNSLGLRGAEPVLPKPAGTQRLVLTGDSVVYGFGVPEEALMSQVAAAELGVEGWAAAVPGYSTYQTINLLEMSALELQPDVVIIANLWSDLGVTGFQDRAVLQAWSAWNPWPPRAWAEQHSALFRGARLLGRWAQGDAAEARVLAWRGRPQTGAAGRRVPINEYAQNLDRLVAMCNGAGAQVGFLLLPIRDTRKGMAAGGSEAAYAQVMQDTAARHGAPLIDGARALDGPETDASGLWNDATHLSAAGHERVGKALAEALGPWRKGARFQHSGTGQPRPAYVDPDPHPSAIGPLRVPDDMIPDQPGDAPR